MSEVTSKTAGDQRMTSDLLGVLQLAQFLIATLNANSKITYYSDRLARILGATGESLVGRNWFDLCFPLDCANRAAWPDEDVLRHVREQSRTRFDPQVVEIFLTYVEGRTT